MTNYGNLQGELAELKAIGQDPQSAEAIHKLEKALCGSSNHLAATAARIVGESDLVRFEDLLVESFWRFMDNPLKTDKGCIARKAIAEALFQMGSHQEGLFLEGIRHVQLEPVCGGKEDTAAELRYVSAMGLVRAGYPEVMLELAQLLADVELDARIGAVRAIAYARQEAGVPLLRFKALTGDADARVIYECFRALLDLTAEEALPFVASFFTHEDPAVAESAILAIGESRLAGALGVLREGWENTLDQDVRRFMLLAIAMLREEDAIDFLVSLIAEEPPGIARDAIKALEMYQGDERIWGQVRELIEARDDIDWSTIIER